MNHKTYDKGFTDGYQAGMTDIAQAYERGGMAAVMTWVQDNLLQPIEQLHLGEQS